MTQSYNNTEGGLEAQLGRNCLTDLYPRHVVTSLHGLLVSIPRGVIVYTHVRTKTWFVLPELRPTTRLRIKNKV